MLNGEWLINNGDRKKTDFFYKKNLLRKMNVNSSPLTVHR